MHMSIVGPESVAPGRFLRLPTILVLALLGVLLGLTGCDDGNSTGPDPEPPSADGLVDVRITEVSEGNQWVELYNAGTEPVDVSSAWLCIPNGYQRVGDQSIVGPGDYVLDPGEWVAVEYSEIAADAGSVALYLNSEDFTNAESIVDYVRWGDTNEGREAVAVDAGIWTAGDFIQPALPGNTISFLGGDPSANDSPSDWSEGIPTAGTGNDPAARLADLRITEVSEANQWVEVYNTGDTPVDIREAWLCVPSSNTGGDNIYVTIDGQPIVGPGDDVLDPGEWVAVEWDQIVPTDGSVGLYARAANGGRPDFADAGRIVDYVRWGDTNEGREAVAVAAGIWTAGAFIEPAPSGNTIALFGDDPTENDDISEWRAGDPTPGAGNDEAEVVTVTIDNIGASAWEVTDVEGESGVAPIGAQNPSLTLTVGRRYRIVNNGGGAHPFGIQNAADEYLLNQDGSGSLEADANIRYQEDANGVTFTYTQALADVGATYRCTVHAAMTGAVETR
jgi:hypothetical protein